MRLPAGFTASGIACGLKPSGKPDLGIVLSDRPAVPAAVFTSNRFQAAPVQLAKRTIRRGSARAIVVNAGNANACTGKRGLADAKRMARLGGDALGIGADRVLVCSTGVIGEHLDMGKVEAGIAAAAPAVSADGGEDFARAIMTTDTRQKVASAQASDATVVGIAKGAGMMAPAMATMLAFVLTDAPVERGFLTEALQRATKVSFNAICLDSCMSTNDTVLVLANGAAGGDPIAAGDPRADGFEAALTEVCASLARQIADDGEGMTKLVTIRMEGCANEREARLGARAIADSLLVRCALNGGDPYWGRILAALGTVPFSFDPNAVDVWMGGEKLAEGGTRGPGDADAARAAMQGREIEVRVDMRRGAGSAMLLTNDLSVEYVRFNTEYTT